MTDTSQDEDYTQLLNAVHQLRRDHDRDLERKSRKLLHEVENSRYQRQEDCARLLHELMPLLEAARRVDRELDFHVAHRFNALRYLRNDELGLSNIIADLLDPSGAHGQGTTFLQAILELLSVAPEGSDSQQTNAMRVPQSVLRTAENILVEKERTIKVNGRSRRIDITVDIRTRDSTRYCLALENKPYARDQHDQCSDYLTFLKREYSKHFLLVYLPKYQRMPDDLASNKNLDCWTEHFRVLPYVAHGDPIDEDLPPIDSELADSGKDSTMNQVEAADSEDDLSKFVVGDGASLADWFGTCIARTHAERLRWFLRETQLFCQQEFGGFFMTDTEARYIVEYLEKNLHLADSAHAVVRAWPEFTHVVCKRFLSHITEQIRDNLPDELGELTVNDEDWSDQQSYVTIYRKGWRQYDGDQEFQLPFQRTAIYLLLEHNKNWWWADFGVTRPIEKTKMTPNESKRQEILEKNLAQEELSNSDDWWLHLEKQGHKNWTVILPELAVELYKGQGKFTTYYLEKLLNIVERAVPIIDAVEMN